MADSKLNEFVGRGTTAQRLAFTPSVPSPASGPAQGYLWWDTDLQEEFAWDVLSTAWVSTAGSASGTVTHTGALTANELVIGNGSADEKVLGSLGTTTTVLHGNASGAPSFGAVNLATDVTGQLPLANLASRTSVITLGVNGNGSVITTGIKDDVYVPVACTITAVTMLADQTGSIVVDIWKAAYSAFPPTIANTITASDLPTISSAVKSQDTTLTGWTTSISAGDVLRFNVNSATSITRLKLELTITIP